MASMGFGHVDGATIPSPTATFGHNPHTPIPGQPFPRRRPPKYHWYASRILVAITFGVILVLAIKHAIERRRLARIRHTWIATTPSTPRPRDSRNRRSGKPRRDIRRPLENGYEPFSESRNALIRPPSPLSPAPTLAAKATFVAKTPTKKISLKAPNTHTTQHPPLSFLGRVHRRLYLTSLPGWMCGPDTLADALFSGTYCALISFFALHKSSLFGGTSRFENQMGVIAFSQLPLLLLLAAKNNPIERLTGITYQKLNYLHRAGGRVCLLASWVHAVGWGYRIRAGKEFEEYILTWGKIALWSFTALWLTSFQIVRRVAWEFFIVCHILFTVMFLVAAMLHWRKMTYWVWPALAIWVLDRCVRGFRLWRYNRAQPANTHLADRDYETVELVDRGLLRVTIRRKGFKWAAGQHAFIYMPTVTFPHETHPFSVANVPSANNNEAVFLIRVHGGATKKLRDALTVPATRDIPLKIEGPYGAVHSFETFDSVVLFAGGTGVTYCFSHLLDLVNKASLAARGQPRTATRHIRLVWHIRQATDISWIVPLLNEYGDRMALLNDLSVNIDLYVTKEQQTATVCASPTTLLRDAADLAANYGSTDSAVEGIEYATPDGKPPKRKVNGKPNDTTGGGAIQNDHTGEDAPTLTPAPQPQTPKRQNGIHPHPHPHTPTPQTPNPKSQQQQPFTSCQCATDAAHRAHALVNWHVGRGDFGTILRAEMDARGPDSSIAVVACGPRSMYRSVRNGVAREAGRREGDPTVEFYEETLGA